jgi:hypothetical protein
VIARDFGLFWVCFCGFELFLLPAPGADCEGLWYAQGGFSRNGQVITRFWGVLRVFSVFFEGVLGEICAFFE